MAQVLLKHNDVMKTRVCDNPAPEFGGDDCTVDGSSASETQRCNEEPEYATTQLLNLAVMIALL